MSKLDVTKQIRKQYKKLFSRDNYKAFYEVQGSKWFKKTEILINIKEFKKVVGDTSDDFYLNKLNSYEEKI